MRHSFDRYVIRTCAREFGRRNRIAETRCRLMALRDEFGAAKPLRARASTVSLHMPIQTAVLIET